MVNWLAECTLLDRLLHHAIVVQIEGSSYRLREHVDLSPEICASVQTRSIRRRRNRFGVDPIVREGTLGSNHRLITGVPRVGIFISTLLGNFHSTLALGSDAGTPARSSAHWRSLRAQDSRSRRGVWRNTPVTVRAEQVVRVEKRRNQKFICPLFRTRLHRHTIHPRLPSLFVSWKGSSPRHRRCIYAGWRTSLRGNRAKIPKAIYLGLQSHLCVPFNLSVPIYEQAPRTFGGLKEFLGTLESRFSPGHLAEGIVFHHPPSGWASGKDKAQGLPTVGPTQCSDFSDERRLQNI